MAGDKPSVNVPTSTTLPAITVTVSELERQKGTTHMTNTTYTISPVLLAVDAFYDRGSTHPLKCFLNDGAP